MLIEGRIKEIHNDRILAQLFDQEDHYVNISKEVISKEDWAEIQKFDRIFLPNFYPEGMCGLFKLQDEDSICFSRWKDYGFTEEEFKNAEEGAEKLRKDLF